MTININAANITSIRLAEQSSAPSTPASGFASLFVDTNGDLATRKDAGGIKIATSPATGDYIFTIDGTGTAARLNASNVFTSAQVLPAGSVGSPALTTTGDTNTGIYFPGADRMAFATGGVIRGSWTTDGLCFGSDTAAVNALDDYEEGTWTPLYRADSGTLGSITYNAVRFGNYVKIGSMVHVCGLIATDAFAAGTGSGPLTVSGLPFTLGQKAAGSVAEAKDFAGDVPRNCWSNDSLQYLLFNYKTSANGADLRLQVSDAQTGSNIGYNFMYFSITYIV